jgi:hypothetical protein
MPTVSIILYVHRPLGDKQWKVWDWKDGKQELCVIAGIRANGSGRWKFQSDLCLTIIPFHAVAQ